MTAPIARLRALTASQSPATGAEGVMSEAMASTWYHELTEDQKAEHDATVERQYQEFAAGTEEEGDAHLEQVALENGTLGETEDQRLTRETAEYWAESVPAPDEAEANEREAEHDCHEADQDEYDRFIAKEAEHFAPDPVDAGEAEAWATMDDTEADVEIEAEIEAEVEAE